MLALIIIVINNKVIIRVISTLIITIIIISIIMVRGFPVENINNLVIGGKSNTNSRYYNNVNNKHNNIEIE